MYMTVVVCIQQMGVTTRERYIKILVVLFFIFLVSYISYDTTV